MTIRATVDAKQSIRMLEKIEQRFGSAKRSSLIRLIFNNALEPVARDAESKAPVVTSRLKDAISIHRVKQKIAGSGQVRVGLGYRKTIKPRKNAVTAAQALAVEHGLTGSRGVQAQREGERPIGKAADENEQKVINEVNNSVVEDVDAIVARNRQK